MRTNIILDDDLVNEALAITKIKTKKELINKALTEFVKNHKRLNLLDIAGKITFIQDYDYKAMREGK
jgi:Arc/MetJ family transcription regulator